MSVFWRKQIYSYENQSVFYSFLQYKKGNERNENEIRIYEVELMPISTPNALTNACSSPSGSLSLCDWSPLCRETSERVVTVWKPQSLMEEDQTREPHWTRNPPIFLGILSSLFLSFSFFLFCLLVFFLFCCCFILFFAIFHILLLSLTLFLYYDCHF